MDDYLAGLLFLAIAVFTFTLAELNSRRYKALQGKEDEMHLALCQIQGELRDKEREIDQLRRRLISLPKWKQRALELDRMLRTTKESAEYISLERMRYLEEYIAKRADNGSGALFLQTSPARGRFTFQQKLNQMLSQADFEIVVVSPWIKRQMWERIKGPLRGFVLKGGKLKVFIRGCESDYSLGLSDDITEEIRMLGGEVISIDQLHAKLYMVDRKQAIISSANLTRGGAECNYEAGVWLNDPAILRDLCAFIDDLYALRS